MKQLFFTIIALLIGLQAMAGNMYRWVDKHGVHHFSDTPPEDTNLKVKIVGTTEKTPEHASLPQIESRANIIRVDLYKDFKYIDKGMPFGLSVGHTRGIGMSNKPYEQLIQEPDYRYAEVLYGYLQMGNTSDNRITFAVDGTGSSPWLLYFDKNNNQDLTDDGPPYTNQGTGQFASSVNLQIGIITSENRETIQPYKIWFWIKGNNRREKIPFFYARCHYWGQVLINGRSYNAVAFEKDNHDGLFRDSGICIDFDNDNKCGKTEHFFHGETFYRGQDEYKIVLNYP